jgi:hypothetical protein
MLRRSPAGSQDERQAEGGSCVVSPSSATKTVARSLRFIGSILPEIDRLRQRRGAGGAPACNFPPAIRRRRFDVLLVVVLIQEPAAPRCARCQGGILDRDLVLRLHGDWYHVRCVRTRSSDGASNPSPVVLCAICRTGIGRVADVVMTDSGPKHHWCRPVVEPKRDAGADRGHLRIVTDRLDATDQ